MKTTITKKLLGLALSVFSMTALAQCPTITNLNVTIGANGTATINPAMTGTVSPTLTNYYWLVTQNSGFILSSSQLQAQFQFPANGTYLVCFSLTDSLNGCSSNSYCDSITISNMLPTNCNAAFTSYTDSACITHFLNSSTGNNLTYQWYDISNGYVLLSTLQNPTLTLANGANAIALYTYSSGQFCDTMNQYVYVNCSGNPANTCNASFTAHTDSNCVTHFTNSSTGNSLTYNWNINGSNYSSQNLNLYLANGSYPVILNTYSAGFLCDSAYLFVNVTCSGTNTTSCNPSFTYYTDSINCNTYFTNQTTGVNLTYEWYDLYNGFSLLSSAANPTLSLSNGSHYISLYTYSNGLFCDSLNQYIYLNCGNSGTTTPTGCQANSQFSIFSDSLNTGNYFAYNLSSASGSVSYLWNFGDGTSSTQQYPFHQYAVPGQYIVCLTVTGTYTTVLGGATTCSDTHCDSSSVHRMAAGFLMSQVNVVPQAVTGIKQAENNTSLKAFPNPITDELTIEATTTDNSKLTYTLIDALGRSVLTGNLNNSKATINTSSLEKGFYSLSITNEKGSSLKTIKLVK